MTTTTKQEAVAKALRQDAIDRGAAVVKWDALHDDVKEPYLRQAQAALSAIELEWREMREALAAHIWLWRHPSYTHPDWDDVKGTRRGHKYLDVADAALAFLSANTQGGSEDG